MSRMYILKNGTKTNEAWLKLDELCAKYLSPKVWTRLYVGIAVHDFYLKLGAEAVLDLLSFILWAEKTNQNEDMIFETIIHDLAGAGQSCFSPRSSGYSKILEESSEEK